MAQDDTNVYWGVKRRLQEPSYPNDDDFPNARIARKAYTGLEASRLGSADLAINSLEEVLIAYKKSALCWHSYAAALVLAGRSDDAVDPAIRALVLAPDWYQPMKTLLQVWSINKDINNLLWLCSRMLARNRFDTHALRALVDTHLNYCNNARAAEPLIDLLIDLLPAEIKIMEYRGFVYLATRKYDCAADAFEMLAVRTNRYPVILNNWAWSLACAKQYEEAEKILEESLLKSPDDAAALDSMGFVCFNTGRLTEAQKYYEKAVQAEPDDVIAWNHLAEVHAKRHLWEKVGDTLLQAKRTELKVVADNPDQLKIFD